MTSIGKLGSCNEHIRSVGKQVPVKKKYEKCSEAGSYNKNMRNVGKQVPVMNK